MGVSLTWRTKDMIQHGKCGPYLDDIVYFSIPGSLEESHPELESHFVLNDPSILQEEEIDILLPTYRNGYAILFKKIMNRLSIEEIRAILWDIERDIVPKSHPARYYRIEQAVEQQLSDTERNPENPFNDFDWNPIFTFVRWVSKEEYLQKAKEAQQNEGKKGYEITTRWNLMADSDHNKECIVCPLAIDLEPGKEKSEYYQYCLHGAPKDGFLAFFKYISKFGEFAVLTRYYRGVDESDADEIRDTKELAALLGKDDIIIETKSLVGSDILPVSELDMLIKELSRSKSILESSEVAAMDIYDKSGKKISTNPGFIYLEENISHGYRVNVSQDMGAIRVEYAGPNIFSIPKNIEQIIREGDRFTFYFTEVRRHGKSFIGSLAEYEIELPPVKVNGSLKTPFNGLDDKHLIGRIKLTSVPAISVWGYFQTLFEKYAEIAKKFNIPIKFS